jgi:hypothetical protein
LALSAIQSLSGGEMDEPSIDRRTPALMTRPSETAWPAGRLAVLWLGANSLAVGLAGAFFHNFPLAQTFPPDLARLGPFSLMPALLGGVLFGFAPALAAGLLQRWVLRLAAWPLSRWWIVSISSGLGLLHFLSDGFESARDLSAAVFVSGLVIGLLQWRLLRPYWPGSAGWVLASAGGWHLGWVGGLAILEGLGWLAGPWVSGLDFKQHGVLGVTTGLGYALGTGLFWLTRRQRPG